MSFVLRYTLRVSTCKALNFFCYSSVAQHISQKHTAKVINVAIIGAPNSGKSTLINRITERKICAASNKVHTTTKLIRAICYENDTQIVFLDTPGIVTNKELKRYKLPEAMRSTCEKSLRCADVVGVVHDVSNNWTKETLHSDVLEMLNMTDVPSFLIINKIDRLKSKKQLLGIIRNLTNGVIAGNRVPNAGKQDTKNIIKGYSNFSDVFLVSALKGDGVTDIKEYLVNNSKPASLQYSANEWTDQTPETLIEEAVRAKFLDFLAQEIPYNLQTQLEYYEEMDEQNKILCSVSVECPSERLMKLVSGAGGGRLQQIKSHVRNDLVDMFRKPVVIDIKLKVKNKSLVE